MNDDSRPPVARSLLGIGVALTIAALVTLAASTGSASLSTAAGSFPAFAIAAAVAFGIQWIAFVPAFIGQSERYYDLIGSLTYLSVAAFAYSVNGDPRSGLLTGLIGIWAVRLGSFLFLRIRDAGSDQRFDRIKPFFFRFLMTWTLQGLWVLITAGAALAAMTSAEVVPIGPVAVLGLAVWIAGFTIEVIADRQKRAFRRDPENRHQFIHHGLWAWSRHPNYFGEITLWLGIALIALPALSGWQHVTLISPLFVYVLLTRVSGVPLLARLGKKRWGHDPVYQEYLAKTPTLFPRPPR